MTLIGYPPPRRPRDPDAWVAWARRVEAELAPDDAAPLLATARRKIAVLCRARAPGAVHPADAGARPRRPE